MPPYSGCCCIAHTTPSSTMRAIQTPIHRWSKRFLLLRQGICKVNIHQLRTVLERPLLTSHEGWGMVDLRSAVNSTWIDGDSVQTTEERGWSFIVPAASPDLRVVLSWTDPASTPAAATNLVNDLDLAVKDPSGTWTNLSNNLDNLRGLSFLFPCTRELGSSCIGNKHSNWTSTFRIGVKH